MMIVTAHDTLGDLVTNRPSLARELERWDLDYCCGGNQTLQEACSVRGLDPDAVIASLEVATHDGDDGPPAWATMGIGELVAHIEDTHHRYLWDEMPRLSMLIDKIVGVHGDRHPELVTIRATFDEIRADLEPHLTKEERVLFPMIRELASATSVPSFHCGSLRNPISVMLREHDALGQLLARMRSLSDGYQPPADGCASYRACFAGLAGLERDTHLHVHKENNVLFPAVVAREQELTGATR